MKQHEEHSSGRALQPSQQKGPQSHPGNYNDQQLDSREGTVYKAEETSSKPSSFDDVYEVEQKDEMTREEAKTEDENS